MTAKVKLAVMKSPGHVPGCGYHYMLYPMPTTDSEVSMLSLMGYTIVEVEEKDAKRLLLEAQNALKHQCEIAKITERPKA